MSELTAQRVKAFVDEVASDWDTTRGRSVGIPDWPATVDAARLHAHCRRRRFVVGPAQQPRGLECDQQGLAHVGDDGEHQVMTRQPSWTKPATPPSRRFFSVATLPGISFRASRRDEEPADAVTFEVDGDGQTASVLGEWLDGDVDDGPHGSVDAADAPGLGWVDVGELGSDRPVGKADAPGGQAAGPQAGRARAVHVAVDDALLPFGNRAGSVA